MSISSLHHPKHIHPFTPINIPHFPFFICLKSIFLICITNFIIQMLRLSTNPTTKTALPNQINTFPTMIKASTRITPSLVNIPTMEDILETSKTRNLDLNLQKLGPFFRITAKNSETKTEVGRAEGVIRVWFDGKILHLDSIKLSSETLSMRKSIFGVGLFLGAVAVRHGFDSGCTTAQLLAINDTDLYHSKLVRFYSRMGFKVVHEVDGSSIGDLSHLLVWGGRGTRMDADTGDLLTKWCTMFKPRVSRTERQQT